MAGAALVRVSGTALIGQPVAVAVRELRRQGLAVRVRWMHSRAQAPGTVVSVQPAGPRPAGSLVTVTGALRPAGGEAQPGARGDDNVHGHRGKHRPGGDGNGQGDGPIQVAGRLQ